MRKHISAGKMVLALTVATDVGVNERRFLRHARLAGWTDQLVVLGTGRRWCGWRGRCSWLLHYLAEGSTDCREPDREADERLARRLLSERVGTDEPVLITDCGDVTLLGGPDLLERLVDQTAIGTVIFGAEDICAGVSTCGPGQMVGDHGRTPAFLNHGLYFGRRKDICLLLAFELIELWREITPSEALRSQWSQLFSSVCEINYSDPRALAIWLTNSLTPLRYLRQQSMPPDDQWRLSAILSRGRADSLPVRIRLDVEERFLLNIVLDVERAEEALDDPTRSIIAVHVPGCSRSPFNRRRWQLARQLDLLAE